MSCGVVTLIGDTSVAASLTAMDCQINQAVGDSYGRLFGSGGALGLALTLMLSIYVGLIGFGFLTGRTRLTLGMMSPRLLTLALVLTFATAWPAYQTVFTGLFMGGPDEVVSHLMGGQGSAVMNFAFRLDHLFARFAEIARALDPVTATSQTLASATPSTPVGASVVGQVTAPAGSLNLPVGAARPVPVTLIWLSGLIMMGATLGVLVIARLVLYLLLLLGPVFIVLALFPQMRGLFNGWLKTCLGFAILPVFCVLAGTAALSLFEPLINLIAEDPGHAVSEVQPCLILFLSSLIYAVLLLVVGLAAGGIVRDWRATQRDRDARTPIPSGGQAWQAVLPITAATAAPYDMRILQTMTALGTGPASPQAVRVEITGSQSLQGGTRRSAVSGLGQRFRTSVPAFVPLSPVSQAQGSLSAAPGDKTLPPRLSGDLP